MRRIISLLVITPLVFGLAFGQNPGRQDSVPDSLKIYKSIEQFAKKKSFTHKLFKAVFRLPDPSKRPPKKKKRPTENFEKFSDKIVRDIIIETLDPFGYSVYDSTVKPRSFVQKGGNALHKKSTRFTIKNQLLIRKGEPLDLLKLKESERLLRQSDYVNDLAITLYPAGDDSVDVYIREKDLWSIGVGIGASVAKEKIRYRDQNFLGLAHQLEVQWHYYNDTRQNIVEGNYTVPYLKNTYMTLSGNFTSDRDNYSNGISLSRPFYSPLTRWAWGVDYLFHGSVNSFLTNDGQAVGYRVRYKDLDLWLGRSYPLSSNKSTESRSTKLITALRYINRSYSLRPPEQADPSQLASNSQFMLAGLGISNRTYYHDFYIYKFGTPEDVPEGRIQEFLVGYEHRSPAGRIYLGAMTGFGNYYNRLGYLAVHVGYGTFFRNGRTEQSVVNGTIGYFSDLLELNEWRLRQFIKIQCVYGIDRKPGELININNESGINGFESPTLAGTNKCVITLQGQLYLPYSLWGFRFAPFLFLNFGMLGTTNRSFLTSTLYQGYGIGLLIKNELLTINTFQVSIGWYPYIPGAKNNLFRYNPINTYDFTFRDFDIQKPSPITYE